MNLKISKLLVARLVKKCLFISLLLGILFAGVAGTISYKVKDTYTSSGQLVQNDSNYGLIDSYKQFIVSSKFKNLMKKQIAGSKWKNTKDKDYSISITTTSSSPFFTLIVSSNSGDYAQYISNLAMKMLITNIGKYLTGANISMVSAASNPRRMDLKMHILKIILTTFVLSTLILFLAFSYKEVFGGKIKDDMYLQDVYQLRKLGSIDAIDTRES